MKSGIEIEAYSRGFRDGAMTDPRNVTTIMVAGYSFDEILKLVLKDQEEKAMAKNTKYAWCSIDANTDKEFLGWLYDRLQNVFGEKWDLDYMQRFNKIIDKTEGFIPDGPKMVVDHVDKQPIIIKRNGKIVYQD